MLEAVAIKEVTNSAFTGDLLYMRIEELPAESTLIAKVKRYEVAPSHIIESDEDLEIYRHPNNTRRFSIISKGKFTASHTRPNATHESVRFVGAGVFRLQRQKEQGPEGYRTVED